MRTLISVALLACAVAGCASRQETPPASSTRTQGKEFTSREVLDRARGFFGDTTEGLAKGIEKLFAEQGRPNAIILGEEGGGAIVVGLRYGRGTLETASGTRREVFWQGPSVGFDVGGNAAKVFTLVYNLDDAEQLYQRFPGVDGSLYFIAGLSVNYQRSGNITLAPIRTGVGWRQGANIGYLHYTRERSINPL
jgi:hypothetical protein